MTVFFRINEYQESLDSRDILSPTQDCGETADHQRQEQKEKQISFFSTKKDKKTSKQKTD